MSRADVEVLHIEVVYAESTVQHLVVVKLDAGATVGDALQAACSNSVIHGLDIQQHSVGVWGQPTKIDAPLRQGDRVEIYRPLKIDAKSARRRRAEQQRLNPADHKA